MLSFSALLLVVSIALDICGMCDGRGVVACKEHSEEEHAFESEVEFCSIAARCQNCTGALFLDCPRCEKGTDSERIAARPALVAKWLEPTDVEVALDRPVTRVDSTHFALVVESGDRRGGRKRVDQHTLAHLLVRDLEHMTGRMTEHLQLTPKDFTAKVRMWMWEHGSDHEKVMNAVLGMSGSKTFAKLGRLPILSAKAQENADEVDEIRMLFVHNAAHLIASHVIEPRWVGETNGGWFDAAIGHWYEYDSFGETQHYCLGESAVLRTYERGKWRAAVRRRLTKEDERFLPRLVDTIADEIDASDQALCWSLYDYLVERHPGALRSILADLKAKKDTRDVVKERLGTSVLELESAWREWVALRYPKRGDVPVPDDE